MDRYDHLAAEWRRRIQSVQGTLRSSIGDSVSALRTLVEVTDGREAARKINHCPGCEDPDCGGAQR